MNFVDRLRRIPGLGAIPGGTDELSNVEIEQAQHRALRQALEAAGETPTEAEDSFGVGDMVMRLVAGVLFVFAVVVFVVGTYFWTEVMTDTFSPLGYAMTPIGMYGILIVLIPVMSIIHGLWTSSDVKRRKAEALAAARDKLRVSLLSGGEGLNRVKSSAMPASMLFGESEEELTRRRRAQQQGRG